MEFIIERSEVFIGKPNFADKMSKLDPAAFSEIFLCMAEKMQYLKKRINILEPKRRRRSIF